MKNTNLIKPFMKQETRRKLDQKDSSFYLSRIAFAYVLTSVSNASEVSIERISIYC